MTFINDCIKYPQKFVNENWEDVATSAIAGVCASFTVTWLNSKQGFLASSNCVSPLISAIFMGSAVLLGALIYQGRQRNPIKLLIAFVIPAVVMNHYNMITLTGAAVNGFVGLVFAAAYRKATS